MITIFIDKFLNLASSPEDVDRFIKILENERIPFKIEKTQNENAHKALTPFEKHKAIRDILEKRLAEKQIKQKSRATLIFENDICEVFVKTPHQSSSHLEIRPKRPLSEEFLLSLYLPMLRTILKYLKDHGFPAYSLSENLQTNTIILVPIPYSDNTVDLTLKMKNIFLFIFGEAGLVNYDCPPQPFKFQKPTKNQTNFSLRYPPSVQWLREAEYNRSLFKILLYFLQDAGIITGVDALSLEGPKKVSAVPIEKHETKEALEGVEIRSAKELVKPRMTGACAFCKPENVKKQLILDLGDFVVLVNFKPYESSPLMCLIVPKHIEDFSDLTVAQWNNVKKIEIALYKTMRSLGFPEELLFTYLQNGACAGQTVTGSHLHVAVTPNYISALIGVVFESTTRINPLTAERIAELAKSIQPTLFQLLLGDTEPDRLQLSNPIPTFSRSVGDKYQPILALYNARKNTRAVDAPLNPFTPERMAEHAKNQPALLLQLLSENTGNRAAMAFRQ